MKKVFMTILTAFMVSAAFSQINKGAWLMGASSSLGYNSYSFKSGSDLSLFNIDAKSGYFVANNFVFGLNLGYSSFSQSSTSSTQTTAGAFARYYLPKNVFLGVGINSVSTSVSSGSFSSSTSRTNLPFELGIACFVTKNFAIEPSISYIKADDKGGVTYKGMDIGASSSLGLNVGFTLYLNRNEE